MNKNHQSFVMKIVFAISILFFSPGFHQYTVAQNMDQKIKSVLSKKYPSKVTLKEGDLQYNETTVLLKLDFFQSVSCCNNLQFYKTTLQTAYFEFPEVEILIAAEISDASNMQILKSLSFEPPDMSFMKLFYGCQVQTAKQRQELAYAITKLMASVAVKPATEMLLSENPYHLLYRISQANHSYIDFTYKFSKNEKLETILIHGN